MALNISDITPNAAAPVAPTEDEFKVNEVPEREGDVAIPDAVLQVPYFRALLEGAPPAVRVGFDEQFPEKALIEENAQDLIQAGFGFYRTKANDASVLFNTRFVSPKELAAADKAGKLDTIAPPFSELKGFFDQSLSGDAAAPVAPAVNPTPVALPPQPAGSADKITAARLKNLAVGSPTSGPQPGAGRILNNILKTAV